MESSSKRIYASPHEGDVNINLYKLDALHELVSLKRNKLSKYVQAHPLEAGVAGAHHWVDFTIILDKSYQSWNDNNFYTGRFFVSELFVSKITFCLQINSDNRCLTLL